MPPPPFAVLSATEHTVPWRGNHYSHTHGSTVLIITAAKAYLERVRQQAADYGSDEEDDEDSGDDEIHRESGGKPAADGDGLHDRVSSQLQKDFMEAAGHTVRRLASHVRAPEESTADELPHGGPTR